MFIINNTKEKLVYRAHSQVLELEEGLNLVDGLIFNSAELKNHFGDLIRITSEEPITEEPKLNEAPVQEEGEELIGYPETCKPCFADGKSPSKEDCEKCKEKQLEDDLAEVKEEDEQIIEKDEEVPSEGTEQPVVEQKITKPAKASKNIKTNKTNKKTNK